MTMPSSVRLPRLSFRGGRKSRLFRLAAVLTTVAALSLAPAHGSAADRGASVASYIPAAAANPVRPVTVIDREDIALSGMNTVYELLLSRLHYNSFGLYRPFVLGTGRAAFLVNGRPVSDLDIGTFPLSAVERIEVLNGAATLHGGGAIAGAVNIVLRRGHDGAEASAGTARPTDTGAN